MSRTVGWIAVTAVFLLLGATRDPATYEELDAILWVQTSVEYRANTIQTYRTAKDALLQALKHPHWTAALEQNNDFEKLPPAIILDLDETVIDNSVFEARNSVHPADPEPWPKWVEEQRSGLIPGALDFLQFAEANRVAPLYITNRACDPSNPNDPTVRLLRRLQLPLDPVKQRLLCDDGKKGDKTDRRRACAARFRILLMFGDQLSDFLQIPPEAADLAGREKLFQAHQELWGQRWFQLPNPMYGSGPGSWEQAVGRTVPQKLKHLRQ